MTTYYLIRGTSLVSEIDTSAGDVVALPLLENGIAMSLMNRKHVLTMMSNLSLTAPEAIAAFGLTDQRGENISTVFVTRDVTSLETPIEGAIYKLVDIEEHYALWQITSNQTNVTAIHNELQELAPPGLFGIMGIVDQFGVQFYNAAARNLVGMTLAEMAARRNDMVTYLNNLGFENTGDLAAATNEDELVKGFVVALNHTEAQLWNAMVQ